MPLPGFLTSMADKAQNALKDTPIAHHIPGTTRPSSDLSSAPTDSGPTQRGHTFEQIQHQFRQLQQTYSWVPKIPIPYLYGYGSDLIIVVVLLLLCKR